MVTTNLQVQPAQKGNVLAQRRNVKLIQSLFAQIKRDILIAGNKDSEKELKIFTEVNLMTSKKYKEQVDEIIDAIDGTLKTSMK